MRALVGAACLLVACGPRAASPPPAGPPAEVRKGAAREATVDGIHYVVAGDGARTIVLVHGNYDSLGTWDELARRLVPHARVVTLDLPGYGASENRLDDYSLGGLALGVRAVVDELGANEVVLVGNSLGGAVVARFAASWPERVAGVVLEDANFVDEWPAPEIQAPLGAVVQAAAAFAESAEPAREEALRGALRAALPIALRRPGVVDDATVERYVRGLTGAGWRAVLRGREQFRLDGLADAFVAARTTRAFPVLVAWGLDDPLVPVRAADRIRRLVPDARLWLVAGTGHAPHLERPDELADVIVRAFGDGGALPADDEVVIPEGTKATTPWKLNELPYVERAIGRAQARRGPADAAAVAFWLAQNELAVGDLAGAEQAIAPLAAATDAPARGQVAYVRGLLAEARGEPAVAAYLDALRDLEPALRTPVMARLARLPLDPAAAAVVDAAIGPSSPQDTVAQALARADRALATERYEDAVTELRRLKRDSHPLVALRLAFALYGAGRLDAPRGSPARDRRGGDDRLAAISAALATCRQALDARLDRAIGRESLGPPSCTPPVDARLLAEEIPPPILPALYAPAGEGTTALAAVERATAALVRADDDAARAILAAVPAAAAAQLPAFHRLRLALAAAAGDRRAVTEARALVAAHDGTWPWRWALATILHAAGKPADAERELAAALAVAPIDALRQELAWLLADRGRLAEARAIQEALAADWRWQGVLARLPHQRKAAARLAAPPATP